MGENVPAAVVDALDGADDATLQAVIDYCRAELEAEEPDPEELTKADSEPPDEFEGDDEEWREVVEDTEAPARATLTTKEIKGNQYLYWQWSEDGTTKSEYIAPKNPKR